VAQVYSLILSWRNERKKGSASNKTSIARETKSIPSDAVTIPHGKYLTIARVSEICGVKENTVSVWLKQALLRCLDLPGLGQIVEQKELEQYLAENQNRS
jgi:transposase-like protein